MLISDTPLGTSLSTGLSENYQCMLVCKLIDYFLVYCSKYYCLNIIVSINSTSTWNITMNTILNITLGTFFVFTHEILKDTHRETISSNKIRTYAKSMGTKISKLYM